MKRKKKINNSLLLKIRLKDILIFGVLIFVLIYLIWLHYYSDYNQPLYTYQTIIKYLPAETPKEYKKIVKQPVKIKNKNCVVKAYPTKIIIKKEKELPEYLKSNTDIVYLDVKDIPPYEYKTRAISLLNVRTGDSDIVIKRLRPPFIQFLKELSLEVNYNFNPPAIDGRLQFTFLRISRIRMHLYADINQLAGFFSGVGIEIKF